MTIEDVIKSVQNRAGWTVDYAGIPPTIRYASGGDGASICVEDSRIVGRIWISGAVDELGYPTQESRVDIGCANHVGMVIAWIESELGKPQEASRADAERFMPLLGERLVNFGGRIPESLRRRVRMYSTVHEVDMQDVIAQALAEYLARRGV